MPDNPQAAQGNKPDTPPGQAKKEDAVSEAGTPAGGSTADAAANAVNALKELLDSLQQQFDALKVSVQTKIDEIQANLAAARQGQ